MAPEFFAEQRLWNQTLIDNKKAAPFTRSDVTFRATEATSRFVAVLGKRLPSR
jgi:hypothetical protein